MRLTKRITRNAFIGLFFALAGTLVPGSPGGNAAGAAPAGIVWLRAEVSGRSRADIRLPLEWLAAVDRQDEKMIRVDDVEIDCVDLWERYKDLPVGETRQFRKGVDRDGEPYVLSVEALPRPRDRARGKVHLVTCDEKGKVTDIAFPLDVPKLIEGVANVIAGFFSAESARVNFRDTADAGPADLKRLADYGRFVFLDCVDADSSWIRISVE